MTETFLMSPNGQALFRGRLWSIYVAQGLRFATFARFFLVKRDPELLFVRSSALLYLRFCIPIVIHTSNISECTANGLYGSMTK